jgi:type II secretory pathway component PulL
LALVADIYADYHTVSKRHDQLQQEITAVFKNTFPEVTRIVEPAQQMKVKLREAKESMVLPTDSSVHGAVVDVLRDIALRIPKTADVDVANLIIDEDRVRLKGLTDKFKTVDAVKNGLQESGYFKDVAIASAQLDRTGNRVRFELVMGRK